MTPEQGKMFRSRIWHVYCAACGREEMVTPNPGVSADAEAREMGWRRRSGQWTCPKCLKEQS